jgi:ribosomal protein S18 acetylase RimI-like enzyme
MIDRDVRTAGAQDREAVIDALVLAFSTDPIARYIWPTPGDYLRHWRAFSMAIGGGAFDNSGALLAGEGQAAALWLPPGVEGNSEAIGAIVGAHVAPEKQGVLAQVGEQIRAFHPETPHWYLAFVGVDPAGQGRGLGSALIEHGLAQCDAQGVAAYLESSSPKNVPLYERYGFEVIGVIQPGDFPPLTPMLRPARR